MTFGVQSFGELVAPKGGCRRGSDVARCPPISKEVGCRTLCSSKEVARETKANARAHASKRLALAAGEDWTLEGCARALLSKLQKSVGGVGLREARVHPFTRLDERAGTGV